jgi:long-subunit fatty acid transport protein
VVVVLGGGVAYGQAPFDQDKLDLRGRANIILGAGARAFGMGGAFLARADDATAASWNPAGLSYLRRPEVSLVGRWNESRTVARTEGGERRDIDLVSGQSPDFASAAYPVSLGDVSGSMQLSFQRVIPFSGKRTILRPTRFLRLEPNGGFDVLALGSGLQLSERTRLGATLNRWTNGINQSLARHRIRTVQGIDRFELDSEQELEFQLSGWNVNLGVIWSPWESLNLGAVVKTPFTAKVRLRRTRTDYEGAPPSEENTTNNAFDSDAVRLKFPASLGAGLSWRPRSALTISLDYTWTNWSGAEIRNFFTLPKTPLGRLDRPPVPEPGNDLFDSLSYPDLGFRGEQFDAEQYRVGVEYVVVRDSLKLPLRIGYFSDRQFFKPIGGDAPRFNGFTAGTGLVLGPLLLDLAYVVETGSYSDLNQPDEGPASVTRNSVTLHRALVSVIYRYGASR